MTQHDAYTYLQNDAHLYKITHIYTKWADPNFKDGVSNADPIGVIRGKQADS
jgi:hypothetical protein